MKTQYTIQWIHCVSCAQIIEDKLTNLEHIDNVLVHLPTKMITIEHNEPVSITTLNELLKPYWYTLHDKEEQQATRPDNNEQKAFTDMMVSIILAILAILSMTYMIGIDYEWRPKNLAVHHVMMWFLPLAATYIYATVGRKYLVAIKRYIQYGTANMDTLVWIGTATAFVYSFVASTLHDIFPDILSKQLFYEAVIVVIWFIELGKYLEHRVMSKTGDAIKALVWLQAKSARLLVDGQEQEIPLDQVKLWDTMIVKAWEKVPVDGVITEWTAYIDESMITGEPIPVMKYPWETLIGSTVLHNWHVVVEATAIGEATYLQKIITIVQDAQQSKPAIQKLADSIMQYFIPTVLVIATIAWLTWLVAWNIFYPDINAAQFALMSFVWVLVIACPCWLWLATPMAIITWIGHGAKQWILAKNAEWLLQLRKATIVLFDKTWTITEGKPTVVETHCSHDHALSMLASLEAYANHPIAEAITQYAQHHDIPTQPVDGFKLLDGIWVAWTIQHKEYLVCKPWYLETLKIAYDTTLIDTRTTQGKTPLVIVEDGSIIGYVAVADSIKTQSIQAINELKQQWIIAVMVTWDHTNTAQYIAQQVWIEQVHGEVTPEEKATIVTQYKQQWVVCMVWDGINDAPALATADIGVAMSTGTDIAIESAQLTLLHWNLLKLTKAITISRMTQWAVIQNLTWAFAFNIIGIPLAAWLFYPFFGVLLNPAFEGMAMSLSSLTVMLNSLRLQKKRL